MWYYFGCLQAPAILPCVRYCQWKLSARRACSFSLSSVVLARSSLVAHHLPSLAPLSSTAAFPRRTAPETTCSSSHNGHRSRSDACISILSQMPLRPSAHLSLTLQRPSIVVPKTYTWKSQVLCRGYMSTSLVTLFWFNKFGGFHFHCIGYNYINIIIIRRINQALVMIGILLWLWLICPVDNGNP